MSSRRGNSKPAGEGNQSSVETLIKGGAYVLGLAVGLVENAPRIIRIGRRLLPGGGSSSEGRKGGSPER